MTSHLYTEFKTQGVWRGASSSTLYQSVFCFARPAAEDYIHSKRHHLSDLKNNLLITN